MNEDSLRNLLKQVSLINDNYERIAEINGEKFNVFNILGVESDEVKTHSAFLGELLNPEGLHGMKECFLKLFCEHLNLKWFDYANAFLEIEKYAGKITDDYKQGGNIDILITDRNNDNAIIIENKVYAPDQKCQLLRYYNYGQKRKFNEFALFYLTLDGKEATEFSKCNLAEGSYVKISYSEHIINWLNACKEKAVDKALLRETIAQYINLIKRLTNQLNNKEMEKEISDIILSSKQNYIAAQDIFKSFEAAKNSLLDGFWKEIKTIIDDNPNINGTSKFTKNISQVCPALFIDVLPNLAIGIEPLNGKDYNPKFNDLFIGLYSNDQSKSFDNTGPFKEWRQVKRLGYNFDNYETLEKILPTNKESRNVVINDIVKQIIDYIKDQETQELLNKFRLY